MFVKNYPYNFRIALEGLKGKGVIVRDDRRGILLYTDNWCVPFEFVEKDVNFSTGEVLIGGEYVLKKDVGHYCTSVEEQQEMIDKYRKLGYIVFEFSDSLDSSLSNRKCLCCQKSLDNSPKNKIFCSKKCYYRYNRFKEEYGDAIKEKGLDIDKCFQHMQIIPVKCLYCGCLFTTEGRRGDSVFCSEKCRNDYNNKKKKEKKERL